MGKVWGGVAKTVAGLAVAGSMFGCAGALQPKTLSTGTELRKEIKVKARDLGGFAISEGTVKDAIAAALIAGGNAPTTYEETIRQGQTDMYDTYGIRYKTSSDGIELEYLKGPKGTSVYSAPMQSRIVARFPLSVPKSNDGEYYEAVLRFPSAVSMEPPQSGLLGTRKYPLTEVEVVPNLLSKFSALENKRIAIEAVTLIKGEVTVDANPEAVKGNLERILGKYFDGYGYPESSYSLDVKGQKRPLSVKLFPYRNGCKVQYSVPVTYTVSDITSVTQSDIDAIKAKIDSTAKD